MTLTRYQIRNEYGLADKELYSDKEDAEVLLEGSSMAGLVGLLRQLGDLAEFAGEVFHNLHEELMTTSARGQGLAIRLQQLEAQVPNSVEIPILSQTDHSIFFYDPGKSCNISGLEWHSTLKTEEHLISPHKLPHCIIDSYEECRGPPQLYLLDKFDVDGSGSCLKRYSDPSLLKKLTASQLSKDERPSKPKKKASHISNGERTLGDSQTSHAKLNQLFLMDHAEDPEITVKLKRRHLNGPPPINSSSGTGYMEKFLKNSLPYCEIVHETLDQSSSAMETDEVATCNVRVDLSTPSLVYPNNGETRKEREMEAIADDEREGGGAMVYNDTDAPPASTETEADKADVTQTGVLAANVLHHSTEEGASEGTKDVQTNDGEDDHSQHVFSVETGSEMSLTGLVEDQFCSLTNQETEKEPDCLLIQNQHISTFDNFEDLSVDADAIHDSAVPKEEDETSSQDGYSVNTEHAGHASTFEISSEAETLMLDTPRDVQTGNITPSASYWQEDALANSDLAEISSYSGKEDPQNMPIIAAGSSDGTDTQRDGAGDNHTSLNDKASETVPEVALEVDPEECLLGTQECLSPEYYIQTHSQGGQESLSETDSENTTAEAAAESLPPQDVPLGVQYSTSEETLTCNENEAEVEALNAPHQGDITSLNGNIPESVLSMDPTDQENCLDVPMAPFSTSLHVTPMEDLEITPPLPPLPPTQWWMGKLVDSVKTTETQFSPVPSLGNNSFYIHRDEKIHNGLVQGTEALDQSEASVTADESHNTDVDPVEAVLTSAKTTLNEPSKATEEEQSPSESVAWESLLTPEATPEAESTEGLEALEWFSQNLKEHTNPNLTKLEEEPQLDHPLEPPGETEGDNKSYEYNEKVEKLPRDKESLVLGIDRSMLRKVSERNRTQLGARVDENDSLLEIIRSKSFNLRPADASVRHNFHVAAPITNLKVAAILEKANSLRHAMAGSDDDHDSDSWSEQRRTNLYFPLNYQYWFVHTYDMT
ncbi:BnaA09g10670D [Brassica napus]|uniref:Protein SCAR n=1 Tax=Brassica napus TaxID=3708 RepID=A0A078HMQ5_BRANA|nr:BnaA09g10670D [Brassica napus]